MQVRRRSDRSHEPGVAHARGDKVPVVPKPRAAKVLAGFLEGVFGTII